MKTRSRIALLCLVLAIIGGLALLAYLRGSGPAEPRYQGKRLSYWMGAFNPANGDQSGPSRRDAERAIREAGTNAIPVLLRMLRATDPAWKIRFIAIAQKQHLIKFHFTMARDLYQEAEMGFMMLGPRATVAVPELIKLYDQNNSPGSQATIARVIGSLGSAADAAIPSLQHGAAGTNHSVAIVASNALNRLKPNLNKFPGDVSSAINNLRNADSGQRVNAFYQLIGSGERANEAIPTLVGMVKASGASSYWGLFTLEQIDPETAATFLPNQDLPSISGFNPAGDPSNSAMSGWGGVNGGDPLAVGDWSAPVSYSHYGKLCARLLVYEPWHSADKSGEGRGNIPVEMELQDVTGALNFVPATVYFDYSTGFDCELLDGQGNPAPASQDQHTTNPPPVWITVPFDGAVRFRVDAASPTSRPQPNGVTVQLGRQRWLIPAGDTNEYFLSGTFNPPTNHSSPLDYAIWGGTLKLPPVKIPHPKQ